MFKHCLIIIVTILNNCFIRYKFDISKTTTSSRARFSINFFENNERNQTGVNFQHISYFDLFKIRV